MTCVFPSNLDWIRKISIIYNSVPQRFATGGPWMAENWTVTYLTIIVYYYYKNMKIWQKKKCFLWTLFNYYFTLPDFNANYTLIVGVPVSYTSI